MGYGTSSSIGKSQIKEYMQARLKNGDKICDVGAGGGTYFKLLGPTYDWTAVEIWHDSAEHLKSMYNHVYEADIRQFDYPENYDVIIFGDVIEHLSIKDAQAVLSKAEEHCNAIMIAIPYQYKQGPIGHNEAEIHIQDDLTAELFNERYPGYTLVYTNGKYAYYWKDIFHDIDISIIVPCKNLENYITPLLYSLHMINFNNLRYEIIFVFDDDTDKTIDVIKSLMYDMHYTIVLNFEQYAGLARNCGFQHSSGKYIWFVDGDDWLIYPNVVQDCLSWLKENDKPIMQIEFVSNLFKMQHYSMVWQYIFKRELIEDVQFAAMRQFEDNNFMERIFKKLGATQMTKFNVPCYFYNYNRPGSVTYQMNRGQL